MSVRRSSSRKFKGQPRSTSTKRQGQAPINRIDPNTFGRNKQLEMWEIMYPEIGTTGRGDPNHILTDDDRHKLKQLGREIGDFYGWDYDNINHYGVGYEQIRWIAQAEAEKRGDNTYYGYLDPAYRNPYNDAYLTGNQKILSNEQLNESLDWYSSELSTMNANHPSFEQIKKVHDKLNVEKERRQDRPLSCAICKTKFDTLEQLSAHNTLH